MRTFKDSAGREWTLAVTVDVIKRLRDARKVDLCDLNGGEPPLVLCLDRDAVALFGVIYELIRAKAEELGVTEGQFTASIDAACVAGAKNAFWEELSDFFLNFRPTVKELIDLMRAKKAAKPETGSEVEPAESGESSGNSPESAASPQVP